MKPTRILQHFVYFFLITLVASCEVMREFEDIDGGELQTNGGGIPEGFDFSTHKEVTVEITDHSYYVKYDVYAYSGERHFVGVETYENEEGITVTDSVFKSNLLNNLIFTGVPHNGKLSQTISLPNYCEKVYIRRKEGYKYTGSIEEIENNSVNFNFGFWGKSVNPNQKLSVTDYMYCVNGSGELFQIDPITGGLVYLSDMPMGSYTCAIDQESKTLYSIGNRKPFPLMKYSIENNTWDIISNYGKGGPRLDYNRNDGLLYFSSGKKLYTIDPTNGKKIDSWNIKGLQSTSGGDLSFADNGDLFLCSFSGLYKLELEKNNIYQASRISANNLPFKPTSMTFDSNQELWLASNGSSSDLIVMDTETGSWDVNWGMGANNNSDFDRTINDLATFRVYPDSINETDTDNDGVPDVDDDYPKDAKKAFQVFMPSKNDYGTLAFEDLWPYIGDYDFNDVALNYKFVTLLNKENLAVQLDIIYTVKANGAGYINGFGIELENLESSKIESVTGTVLTEDYINENANGTEANQSKAVVILFDNARLMLDKEIKVSIKFATPVNTNKLGSAPFNPFLIIDGNRKNEVHLPKKNPTTLGDNFPEVSGYSKDFDGDYLTDTRMPWAINIVNNFEVPKEKVSVNEAYNFFTEWATSGGTMYSDWFKDNPGYRNADKVQK